MPHDELWTVEQCFRWLLKERIEYQAWLAQDTEFMKHLADKYSAQRIVLAEIIEAQDREFIQVDIEIDKLREQVEGYGERE